MKFALESSRSKVGFATSKRRRVTAVALTIVFGLMMIQPGLSAIAQQSRDTSLDKVPSSAKKKKKKRNTAKTDSRPITVLPSIFVPPAAQGPAVTTQAPAVDQKSAGKLTRPTTTKPSGIGAAAGKKYNPVFQPTMSFAPVNVRDLERQEALAPNPALVQPAELKSLDPPKGEPPPHGGAPIRLPQGSGREPNAPLPSVTGVSPGPSQTFKAAESLVPVIPPDTDGAVGTTHVVTATNDRLRIQDRNGTILSTVTTNSFWSGLVLEGGATPSITDPRVRYDRFNNRFIFAIVANPQTLSSATLIAVTATNDPTGTWFRYAIDCDPTATAAGGMWADFPSIGFNKDWIVIQNNLFGFGSFGTGYQGPQIYAIDKAAIYAGPVSLGAVPTFFDSVANCVGPIFETQLGCGFTMSPSITEDNATANIYLVEDWDSTAAQLRLTKLSGPVGTPVLTVGTQIPQSPNSWRFNATRIQTTGGYMPQKQQSAYLVSGSRMQGNDSRMQNVVYRNGSLWCVHHVMIATTPTAAGTGFGVANPDNHTAIQWWQIDPSIETGLSTTPVQRARIEDATADNCHNGANALVATPPCSGSTLNQHGTFFVFPSIGVNQNNDVLIGFTQFSAFTYPSGAYAYRSASDPINTTRDPVVFHPGQSNDNLGGGSGTGRQNRWGDYSMTMVDPANDSDFWTTQEYSGVYRDFGIGVACPWETWWARVKPSTPQPSKTGNLLITEFRLRGPQGIRDEYIELYNPGPSAVVVNTSDNSDGWAVAVNNGATTTGIAVIPNGTVIPSHGHLLIADDPDSSGAGGLPTVVYSLPAHPGGILRNAESDIGWSSDIADNVGIAIFKTATVANFSVATVMDAAGPATLPPGSLFKEGTGFGALPASGTLQYAMVRAENQALLAPKDTNDNAADFAFVDTTGTVTTAGQRLGSPGPENIDAAIRTNLVSALLLDQTVSSATAPNRARDLTPDIPNASTFGTMTIRRRMVNNTGGPVTRLRFRVVNMTTFPPLAGVADLRVRTSVDTPGVLVNDNGTCSSTGGVPPTAPCLVTVRGTTLETPPTPAASLGGGHNTTLSAGTITLATPLAAGGAVNIQFLLGVQQTGYFQFYVFAEMVP